MTDQPNRWNQPVIPNASSCWCGVQGFNSEEAWLFPIPLCQWLAFLPTLNCLTYATRSHYANQAKNFSFALIMHPLLFPVVQFYYDVLWDNMVQFLQVWYNTRYCSQCTGSCRNAWTWSSFASLYTHHNRYYSKMHIYILFFFAWLHIFSMHSLYMCYLLWSSQWIIWSTWSNTHN